MTRVEEAVEELRVALGYWRGEDILFLPVHGAVIDGQQDPPALVVFRLSRADDGIADMAMAVVSPEPVIGQCREYIDGLAQLRAVAASAEPASSQPADAEGVQSTEVREPGSDRPDEREVARIQAARKVNEELRLAALVNGPTAQRGGLFHCEPCRSLPERAL